MCKPVPVSFWVQVFDADWGRCFMQMHFVWCIWDVFCFKGTSKTHHGEIFNILLPTVKHRLCCAQTLCHPPSIKIAHSHPGTLNDLAQNPARKRKTHCSFVLADGSTVRFVFFAPLLFDRKMPSSRDCFTGSSPGNRPNASHSKKPAAGCA